MRGTTYPPGTRVFAAIADGVKVAGEVTKITRGGHLVKLDDGRSRPVAWWRLEREPDPEGTCRAYTTRGVALARGGTRYNRCKRDATAVRLVTRSSIRWTATDVVHVCGTHAAMLDKGMTGVMDSDSR